MKRILQRLGIVGVVLTLALGAGELVMGRWFSVRGQIYRLDPERLHVSVPNARRLQLLPARAGRTQVLVELNSEGLRGPELRQADKRVLVVGDSLVLSANVTQADSFVAQLSTQLSADGTDWEALNAGLESYGPDQSLLQMEELLPRLKPDLVVLVLCAHNDFGDLHRNKLFGLDAQGQLIRQKVQLGPTLKAIFAQRQKYAAKPALWRAFQAWRERGNAPALDAPLNFVPDYLLAARYQYEDAVTRRNPVVDDIERDTWDADVAIQPDWPSSKHKRALMTRVLAAMGEQCAKAKVDLVALVVPSAVDVDPGFLIRVDAKRYPSYDSMRLSSAMTTCAEEAGLAVLNLQALLLANDPARLFVGGDDFHWNARAQALCAEACATFLEQP
jgi:hypothetical protein